MKIATHNLSVDLGGRRVLDCLDLSFEPGSITAVIGPNGAGKSTLLRALAGLIAPAAGNVAVDARLQSAFAPLDLARVRAYLPQDRIVHWPLAARAVVALGRSPHLAPGQTLGPADWALVDAALDEMSAAAFSDRPVTELSGGERARVLMARALAGAPRILIADEPTAALDPAHQLALFATLRRRADAGTAVILALHDLMAAAAACDRVVLLLQGTVLADGSPRAVLTPANLARAYGINADVIEIGGRVVIMPRSAVGAAEPDVP